MKRLVNAWIAAVVLLISIGEIAAQPRSGEIATPSKQILFIKPYGPNFEPWAVWSKEARDELIRQSPWPLDIQEHSLITARNDDSAAERKLVEYLGALYAQQSPDLIVAFGGPAARFVQQHRANLFPTTPMLLAAVEVRRVEPSMLSEQDAVVGTRYDQNALTENILRLLPETKTIALIIGNSPIERYWVGEQKRTLGPLLENKAELIFYNERPFKEILKALANLPPHSVIFFQQMMVDGAGAVYGDKEPMKQIYEVANAPLFAADWARVTDGVQVVGGPMQSPAEAARPTAAVAVRLLKGEKGSSIKVPTIELSAPKYDWRQLQRWNISESRLPAGSEVLFREPSIWQKYRSQMVAITAVVLLQALLIAGLLYEQKRRRDEQRRREFAEAESRQRLSELAHVNRNSTVSELSTLMAHELNQPLGAILNNAETVKLILEAQSPDLDEIRDIVDDILRDDKRASDVISHLRSLLTKKPYELRNINLNQTVADVLDLLSTTARKRGVNLTKALSATALEVRGDSIQLQQVLLNLIINGMDAVSDTNGGPREIVVRTAAIGDVAEVSVSDSGAGIPPDKIGNVFEPFFTTKQNGMGMGLSIVRTIIAAHGGQIRVENRPGGGASFCFSLPLLRSSLVLPVAESGTALGRPA